MEKTSFRQVILISLLALGAIGGLAYTAYGTTIGTNVTTASLYASSNTGIGTTTPATLLEVQSQATSTLTITTASSTPQDPVLSFRTGANPSENFKIYVDDSDSDKLVIATSTSSNLLTINVAGNVGISTTTAISLFGIENIGALNSFYVSDAANDTTPFVIDGSGNTGVGTSTPSSLFSVQGAIIGSSNITLYGAATSTFVGPIAQPSGNLIIGSGVGNLLLDPWGGNVGIGTSTPGTILHVSSDSATTTITVGDAGSGKGACLKLRNVTDNAWTYCTTAGGVMTCSATSCE